jgi:hypothetical protein
MPALYIESAIYRQDSSVNPRIFSAKPFFAIRACVLRWMRLLAVREIRLKKTR